MPYFEISSALAKDLVQNPVKQKWKNMKHDLYFLACPRNSKKICSLYFCFFLKKTAKTEIWKTF